MSTGHLSDVVLNELKDAVLNELKDAVLNEVKDAPDVSDDEAKAVRLQRLRPDGLKPEGYAELRWSPDTSQ